MTGIAHAHILLTSWAEWSRTGGVIPKKMWESRAKWQFEVATDYPEEPDGNHFDDDEMGRVDAVIAGIGRTHVRHYVVILDVYRNGRGYAPDVEDRAIAHFAGCWSVANKSAAHG